MQLQPPRSTTVRGMSHPAVDAIHRRDRRRDPRVCLLDTQARDGPTDHELLDLFGAFEDVVDLSWTYPLVTGVAVFVVGAGETATGAVRC